MAEMNARQSGAQNSGAMMKKLRMLDFSIVDVGLYLDAYPDSASALEYYKKLVAERERLAAMINASGTPLTSRDGACGCSWNWTNGPWPWKPEAN